MFCSSRTTIFIPTRLRRNSQNISNLISRTNRIVSGLLLFLYASSLNPNRILHTSPRANTVDTESTLGESD